MRSRGGAFAKAVKEVGRTLLATLREVFDESAYVRFLERHGITASSASYARFVREQSEIKARRPRCC
ncbi:MAG TPA: hypothetical protein VFA68_12275 [Terriglobales bacterium]|nr:hypothetical protein [Terriglobales bacterium]